MSEQRKTRSSVAAPERAEETGSASRADTTSKTIVHQTRTGRKRDIFPSFCLLERDRGSIFGTWYGLLSFQRER